MESVDALASFEGKVSLGGSLRRADLVMGLGYRF